MCRTEIRDLSRMCIVISGQDGVVEQARRQLEDLVPLVSSSKSNLSHPLLGTRLGCLGLHRHADDHSRAAPRQSLNPRT